MNPLYFSFCVYFIFYLVCHSTILSVLRAEIFSKLNPVLLYIANCAFCFTFWVSLIIVTLFYLPFWYVFFAPVVNLLVDSLYRGLNNSNN